MGLSNVPISIALSSNMFDSHSMFQATMHNYGKPQGCRNLAPAHYYQYKLDHSEHHLAFSIEL